MTSQVFLRRSHDACSKTSVLTRGPHHSPPTANAINESHPSATWGGGLRRGHLETPLGGIHLGPITFLFIVFLLWRQSRRLTLRNKNKRVHTLATLGTTHSPACRHHE